ncbi:Slam-dependent surface lipoprotein [Necropsobacter massiliensis]|uniref:Slam-dependent surface lipoprotein n=1 Tax=Necropsobacter massiliensis TaxID=1400001 RepID=UPI0005963A8C|nr:Slam-dependent surface lipoprotein [Necropsobacter massiliensis]
MKKSILATALCLSCAITLSANANISSGISNNNAVLSVKNPSAKHDGWFHSDPGGLPGVEVQGVTSKVTSFQSLTKVANNVLVPKSLGGQDKNGVVVLNMNNIPSWVPGFHGKLGNFAFKKVGTQELYYGEWLGNGANAKQDRVVYYAGNNQTQNMPTGGKAVYSVQGINQHGKLGAEMLKGELTADFGKKQVNGSMSKTGLTVSINDAKISGNAFSGAAVANKTVAGTTQGHFFGNNAAALAGYAKFAGHNQYDTAFGGTKK